MRSDGSLRHACQLHCGGAATAEGVTGVVTGVLAENLLNPPANSPDEGRVGQRHVGMRVSEEEWASGLARRDC